jgi:hypothetical protein
MRALFSDSILSMVISFVGSVARIPIVTVPGPKIRHNGTYCNLSSILGLLSSRLPKSLSHMHQRRSTSRQIYNAGLSDSEPGCVPKNNHPIVETSREGVESKFMKEDNKSFHIQLPKVVQLYSSFPKRESRKVTPSQCLATELASCH